MYYPTGATGAEGCPAVPFPVMPGAVEHCKKIGIVQPDPRFGCCVDKFSRIAAATDAKPSAKKGTGLTEIALIGGLLVGVAYLAGGM